MRGDQAGNRGPGSFRVPLQGFGTSLTAIKESGASKECFTVFAAISQGLSDATSAKRMLTGEAATSAERILAEEAATSAQRTLTGEAATSAERDSQRGGSHVCRADTHRRGSHVCRGDELASVGVRDKGSTGPAGPQGPAPAAPLSQQPLFGLCTCRGPLYGNQRNKSSRCCGLRNLVPQTVTPLPSLPAPGQLKQIM